MHLDAGTSQKERHRNIEKHIEELHDQRAPVETGARYRRSGR